MTEETKQEKTFGKRTIIAIGLVCIILAACLLTSLAIYLLAADSASKLESEIASKDAVIRSQNSTITSQTEQIATLQNSYLQLLSKDGDITQLKENYTQLKGNYDELQNVLLLNASNTLLSDQAVQLAANDSTTLFSSYLSYAGYVTVRVQSSSNTAYAQVIYSSFGVDYDVKTIVGKLGEASFPVLPTYSVDIILGNTEASDSVSATVSVIYYF